MQYHSTDKSLDVDADFKLTSAETWLTNSNIFGAVMHGTLIMDARVRHCRVEKRHSLSDYRIFDGPQIRFQGDAMESWESVIEDGPWTSVFDEATLLLLACDTDKVIHGLVLVKSTDSDSFNRAGYFERWTASAYHLPESQSANDEYFQGFKTERVTIV